MPRRKPTTEKDGNRSSSSSSVLFMHPDLGIGGAERLVVDAALGLQRKGHRVAIYTNHHDPGHCFAETRDGTIEVKVYGDWLPRHVFGYMHAIFAYIRMIYLAIVVLFTVYSQYQVIFVDQVSACLPILKMGSAKLIFYCHFPDQLLAMRKSGLKKLYRAPIDFLEEKTTAIADVVLVNSRFTANTFLSTFTSITNEPDILYPSLNFSAFDVVPEDVDIDKLVDPKPEVVFLSINRYERKKNLPLAISAFAELLKSGAKGLSKAHLVLAGGYDRRVAENVEHFQELNDIVDRENLNGRVTFLRSFSDGEKVALLQRCACLLYTPSNEHFGITPLEAMYCGRPVVAVNSGGPLETVVDSTKGQTGFLCEPTPEAFAAAMKKVLATEKFRQDLGNSGRERVIQKFSFDAFSSQLDGIVQTCIAQ